MSSNMWQSLKQCICTLWILAFVWHFFQTPLPNVPGSLIGHAEDETVVVNRATIWNAYYPSWTNIPNPIDFDVAHKAGVESGIRFLPQRFSYWLPAGILLLIAWITGASIVQFLPETDDLYRSERIVLQTGTGLSLFSLWVLIAGQSGFLTTSAVVAPPLVLSAALTVYARFFCSRPSISNSNSLNQIDETPRANYRASIICGLVIAPFAIMLLLGSTTPPWDFDVREYHMQGPKEWYQSGQITFLEHNVYTNFPFLSEMLSLSAMVWQGDWRDGAITGKVLLSVFPLGSTLCAYAIGRRWFGQIPGILAAIACISTPWIFRISVIAYAEGAAAFYLIATTMVCLLSLRRIERIRWQWIILTGLFAGSAMAAKYPGVISTVIPVGLILVVAIIRGGRFVGPSSKNRSPDDSMFRTLSKVIVIYGLGVCIAVGPWLIRNTVNTGNPVYPLLYSVFGGIDLTPELDTQWRAGHSPDDHDLTQTGRHLIDVAVRSDWMNGILFAFGVPGLLLFRRTKASRILAFMSIWMFVTWWALTHRIDRFWVPVIPILAVLAGSAWVMFSNRFWKGSLLLITTVCVVFNFGFWKIPNLTGFQIALMDMEKARTLPVRIDFKQLNLTLPDNARVLMIGEAEVFDAEFEVIYNTVFDVSIFETWTRKTSETDPEFTMQSASEIAERFQRENVTHVVVNWSEILRYRRPGSYGYAEYIQPQRLNDLVMDGVLHQPTVLISGDWSGLSSADQQEIQSWEGGDSLVNDRTWNSVMVYRVLKRPVEDL